MHKLAEPLAVINQWSSLLQRNLDPLVFTLRQFVEVCRDSFGSTAALWPCWGLDFGPLQYFDSFLMLRSLCCGFAGVFEIVVYLHDPIQAKPQPLASHLNPEYLGKFQSGVYRLPNHSEKASDIISKVFHCPLHTWNVLLWRAHENHLIKLTHTHIRDTTLHHW